MNLRRICGWIAVGLVLVLVGTPAGFRLLAAWRETADSAQAAPATGQFVPTRTGRIFLQQAGPADGVPVLLFHGTAAWSELWRATGTVAALADQGFRVIALDLPPFGFSDRPGAGGYTRAEQAMRVSEVLDRLHIDGVIVVGHSFGAGPAVETVMRDPGRIKALVLVDAALGLAAGPAANSPPAPLRYRWIREALVATTVTNPLLTRTLLRMFIHRKDQATPEHVVVLQRPMNLRNSTRDIADWLMYFAAPDDRAMSAAREAYGRIGARTAILWGDKDDITPLAQGEDLKSLIAGATLTVLPGLGHIPQIEDPEVFNNALIAALRGH
jgi:pimeloyl-ACP methyl ester carboxylesterase